MAIRVEIHCGLLGTQGFVLVCLAHRGIKVLRALLQITDLIQGNIAASFGSNLQRIKDLFAAVAISIGAVVC